MATLICAIEQEINNVTLQEQERYNQKGVDFVTHALRLGFYQFSLFFLLICVLAFASAHTRHALAPKRDEGAKICDMLHWLREIWRRIDDGISIDGQVVIRLCELGFKYCLLGTMVCIVLAPLYGTSAVQDEYVGSFLRFTIVTLQPDDTVGLSAVLIASLSLAIGMFYFMKQEWRHFVEMRRTFMLHSAQGLGLLGPGESDEHRHSTTQAHYSILIENLPAGVSDTDETLYQMLQKLFKRIEKQFCIVQENTLLAHRLKALQEITPFTCSWCFEGTCGRAMQCLRKTIVEKEKKTTRGCAD
jgi:hypothetical protein